MQVAQYEPTTQAEPVMPQAPVDLPSQIAGGEAQNLRAVIEDMTAALDERDARIQALEADIAAAQSEALVAPVTRVSAFSDQNQDIQSRREIERNPMQPLALAVARGNAPDDLKQIHGVGVALEALLHRMGYFHFDQIASWSEQEVAWVDENLPGFKGRVSRDSWVEQAKQFVALDQGPDPEPGSSPGEGHVH
ncbi:MAG: hypothetical protein AAGA78_17990 [Pseudomonadota bacterium]